ncbi:Ribonuclease E inhibitor RraA/Dimethylmenaquinone methyltransferase [Niveomyces insectorum RCEF 264]|uniref:Ribonuclease E inhibitor RraA/Dimethylmenaquinone methyltransferase n=1 Tax=Niveomyces insectorum RCEF 264 TaxID=1081102 RepID=A0A167T7Q5_9HYPO|nr:Ribonuclease E inhibitor RraA/Dimethylmenaquinone methyltransferase [Niveomyces insectorum RCEF 264]
MASQLAGRIAALRPFASCDIGDALVKLKYPMGGFLDGISMWSPARQGAGSTASIIGPAMTVKMVRVADPSTAKPPKHFADSVSSGEIMYIQQPKGLHSACFGGLMATRLSRLDAAGVVIDGRFRDIREIQQIGLPMFARATSILGSNTFTRAAEFNVPLQFHDDLWIHPGDILVGDDDGVVVVPPSLVDEVVQLCHERKEIDAKTMQALENGEEMGPTIARLRK